MKCTYFIGRILVLSSILVGLSCHRESPTKVDRPPIIERYSPQEQNVETLVGDTLRFSISAFDPDDESISFSYVFEDSTVSNSPDWVYVVDDTGDAFVEGAVSDGVQYEKIVWMLERILPENLPPRITHFEPEDLTPAIVIGDSINFRITAEDPEGKAIDYKYTVNDTIVGYQREHTYTSSYLGGIQISAIASDGERGVKLSWQLTVALMPDSILPAPVMVVSFETGSSAGEVDISWIAVGDDSMQGLPAHYQIRTSSVPIMSEFEWTRASDRPGEPLPLPPGDTMQAVISGLIPANDVYVAVRARDEFGNLSPLANSPSTQVKGMEVYGTVRNAVSNLTLGGIVVSLSSYTDTTDSGGTFAFVQLPQLSSTLQLRDEDIALEYGSYFDVDSSYVVSNEDVLEFWMLPNRQLQDTVYYSNFLSLFKVMTDTQTNPFGNNLRRWEFPIDIYVPPCLVNGVDYEAEVLNAVADCWEALSEFDLFQVVESPPDIGVIIAYEDTTFGIEKYSVTEWTEDMYPVKATIHLVKKYSPSTLHALQVIIRHEVGHALGLKHSYDPNHLMVGIMFPAVSSPSTDELNVLRAIYHLPRGEDMQNHLYD